MKLRRDENTETRAIALVVGYLDTAQLDEEWLVLFDLRKTVSWGAKVVTKVIAQDGKTVHAIGY